MKKSEFNTVKRKGIRVIQYRGNNKIETIREQAGTKGYAIDFGNIINIVDNIIPRNEVMDKALRKEVPMYPELAIRQHCTPRFFNIWHKSYA